MSLTYIVQIDGPGALVKFGKTRNPKARLSTLRTGVPWPLRIVALIGSDVERELKVKFAADKVQGEWFRPSAALSEWLEKAAEGGKLVRQVAVDQAYVNAVIKPRIREYLAGREPLNNASGDLVRCILNDTIPAVSGREKEICVATKNHVTDSLIRGFGPCIDRPSLTVPDIAVLERFDAPQPTQVAA